MHRDSQSLDLRAKGGVRAHILDDFAHAREQAGVVEHRLDRRDAVPAELSGLADEAGRVGQGSNGNGPLVGRHSAEVLARDERRARAQLRGSLRGIHAGRPGADDEDIGHRR